MKLYTRTGDKGTTSLIGGMRVPKHHPRLEVYGTLDELNAVLGILRLHTAHMTGIDSILNDIQHDLFALGAVLADPNSVADSPKKSLKFTVEAMEWDIDRMSALGPELRTFVIPSGSAATVCAHHARTVCRRAERNAAQLCSVGDAPEWVVVYLNRLGDWLFQMALICN